jgi:hypothetical protein
MSIPSAVEEQLASVYSDIMWLARRPGVSPSMARAWYTHVFAPQLARQVRMFSGLVSSCAADSPDGTLRLEHHHRIQTTLTSLVARHIRESLVDPSEFVQTVVRCESVHIVTFRENYDALKAKGDYTAAGINLIPWQSLPSDTKQILWSRMLKGRVANASDFKPAV